MSFERGLALKSGNEANAPRDYAIEFFIRGVFDYDLPYRGVLAFSCHVINGFRAFSFRRAELDHSVKLNVDLTLFQEARSLPPKRMVYQNAPLNTSRSAVCGIILCPNVMPPRIR